MPTGHDISFRSERYDFYLYDPHAASDQDLLTPSSDSIFHVRSRISGQMLPFLSPATIKEDPHYLEEMLNALGEVVRNKGRDEDVEACVPNMEITIDNKHQVNFVHLLDDTLLQQAKRNPLHDHEKTQRAEEIQQQPIGRFINRHHYATTLATPITRLHGGERHTTLREADYRAIMDEF